MANALYTKGKEKFLQALIDMENDTIRVALVDSQEYTPDTANDEFFSDASAGHIANVALATLTATDGVFDAANATLSSVSGDQSEYLVIYKDGGAAANSPLIALFDTATGLPVTPNGGDINLNWNASGIFAL